MTVRGSRAAELKHGHSFFSGEIVQECLGCSRELSRVQHRCGIDYLTAHLRRCRIHAVKTGRISIGRINNAAVYTGLTDLRRNFLHIGAIGDAAGFRQVFLIQIVISEDFLGVLSDRNIAVAHGHENISGLQQLGQLVETLDSLGVSFGDSQNDLVLQKVDAAALLYEVQSVGVLFRVAGSIQRIDVDPVPPFGLFLRL